VEVGAPDSFADIDAKLKALEEKTKAELAKLQSDTAAPSSFLQEGAPDFSMPEIDAKLKALGEKMKAEIAQLHAGPALPSSFVEVGAPDSFADIDAKLKALEEKTKAELAKLQSDTAAPSSLLQWSSEITDDELARGEREAERADRDLHAKKRLMDEELKRMRSEDVTLKKRIKEHKMKQLKLKLSEHARPEKANEFVENMRKELDREENRPNNDLAGVADTLELPSEQDPIA